MKKVFLGALAVSLAGSALAVSGVRSFGTDILISETITDLGDGLYDYSYTVDNVSAVGTIWWFGVYSIAVANGVGGGSLMSFASGTPSDDLYNFPERTASMTFDFSGLSNAGNGILVGSSGSLHYQAFGLDSRQKAYFADVSGEWAGNGSLGFDADGTQRFSYFSQATPEPASIMALAVGAIGVLRRRRR